MTSGQAPWSLFLASLVNFVKHAFPGVDQRCGVCGVCLPSSHFRDQGAVPTGACSACRNQLAQRTGGFCPRCGLLFPETSTTVSACLDCRLSPPPWQKVFFYGCYEGLLKDIVLRFKFHGQLGLLFVLSEMLASALSRPDNQGFDLIAPIPLHPRKLLSRGFNQSLELARGIAHQAPAIIHTQALTRTRHTPAQHTLPRARRMQNLKGAFAADPALVCGRSILLVDDILTTGATARAASKALLKAGARGVSLVILARA